MTSSLRSKNSLNKNQNYYRPDVRWRWRIIINLNIKMNDYHHSTFLITITCRPDLLIFITWRWELLIVKHMFPRIIDYLAHVSENYWLFSTRRRDLLNKTQVKVEESRFPYKSREINESKRIEIVRFYRVTTLYRLLAWPKREYD